MNIARIVGRQACRIKLIRPGCSFPEENAATLAYNSTHRNQTSKFSIQTLSGDTHRCYCTTTIVTGQDGKVRGSKRRLEVDYDELKSMLRSKSVLLFDVREPSELEKEGKISQAINIPLPQLKDAFDMSPRQFKGLYKIDKPEENEEEIVLYCRSGNRSAQAIYVLYDAGYRTGVKHYPGGYEEWKSREAQHK